MLLTPGSMGANEGIRQDALPKYAPSPTAFHAMPFTSDFLSKASVLNSMDPESEQQISTDAIFY